MNYAYDTEGDHECESPEAEAGYILEEISGSMQEAAAHGVGSLRLHPLAAGRRALASARARLVNKLAIGARGW